ncbi:Hypothetical predicted protein [Marmota monax]|uniref:Microsomal glutathione S-transferase 1 n=1 Tax=Marmota monax TaxID=9995 RepID=A0A5E4B8D3_MARMO|nr:Hypothetical predicted protein [Marmota monax]
MRPALAALLRAVPSALLPARPCRPPPSRTRCTCREGMLREGASRVAAEGERELAGSADNSTYLFHTNTELGNYQTKTPENPVFANPEDCESFGKGENAKKYLRTDDRVERVRRAHLNDLENIVPFVGIGLLYSLSGPDLSTALLHFRLFVGARIYHTIAYLTPLPQPNRALAFFVGFGVTLSMAYRLLKTGFYL